MNLARQFATFPAGLAVGNFPVSGVEKARACVFNGYGIALGSHPAQFLGVAEQGKGCVEDFQPTLVAGYEIGGALETAFSVRTTAVGLRASKLSGTKAGAAVVALLWWLSVGRIAAALSDAASFAGGCMDTDHTEYSYDRACGSVLVRGIGEETGVAQCAHDYIERFAAAIPYANLDDVLATFKDIQTARERPADGAS